MSRCCPHLTCQISFALLKRLNSNCGAVYALMTCAVQGMVQCLGFVPGASYLGLYDSTILLRARRYRLSFRSYDMLHPVDDSGADLISRDVGTTLSWKGEIYATLAAVDRRCLSYGQLENTVACVASCGRRDSYVLCML